MTCNIANAPLYPEPLPLYSRNDPDAVSIRSAAPSYVSEAPTYTSRHASNPAPTPRSLLPPLSPNQQPGGLPAAEYAAGFENLRHNGSMLDLGRHSFAAPNWSSTRTSHNSRQYEAVARRRANTASQTANTTAMLNSLSASPPSTTNASPNASSTNVNAYPVTVGSSSDPVSPLEDPYLVGEEAARRARAQRVYREMCLRGEEVARHESRSWEFMIVQMGDWEERGQSWKNYRKRVGQTKLLGRRLGLRS